jgi:hypothetical protein
LGLGQHQALLRHRRRERLQALRHAGQVGAEPDVPHPEGGHRHAALAQLVGDPQLAPGGLIDGYLDHRRLDRRVDPVLPIGLAPGQLLTGDLATLLVELLEPVEAVPAVAQHLAGLADAAELLGQLQHTQPCCG